MRTINAELYRIAIIRTLEEMEKAGDSQTDIADGVRRALRLLDMQPAVDAVEVVRCRDCVHSCFLSNFSRYKCVKNKDRLFYSDDYCSYGERKEV